MGSLQPVKFAWLRYRSASLGLLRLLRAQQDDRSHDPDESEGRADPELELEAVGEGRGGQGAGVGLR